MFVESTIFFEIPFDIGSGNTVYCARGWEGCRFSRFAGARYPPGYIFSSRPPSRELVPCPAVEEQAKAFAVGGEQVAAKALDERGNVLMAVKRTVEAAK